MFKSLKKLFSNKETDAADYHDMYMPLYKDAAKRYEDAKNGTSTDNEGLRASVLECVSELKKIKHEYNIDENVVFSEEYELLAAAYRYAEEKIIEKSLPSETLEQDPDSAKRIAKENEEALRVKLISAQCSFYNATFGNGSQQDVEEKISELRNIIDRKLRRP